MGAERRSFFMDDKTKLMTAYHEGGHALVAYYTEGAIPVFKVTCMPRGGSLGHVRRLAPLIGAAKLTWSPRHRSSLRRIGSP